MKKPIKNDQENHQNHLNQLQNDYKDIKAQLDALNINTNKTQEDKETEAKTLIQDATSKEKQLQDEIDKINKSSKSTPKAKQEAKNAQNFLDTTNIEIKNLYDNIAWKSSNAPAQSQNVPEQPSDDKNIFSKAWEWIWSQRWDIRDKNKWKDEAWKNVLRTVWFTATWVWAIALAYKWIKKLFWWWKDEEQEKDEEKEEKKSKKEKKKPFRDRWYGKALKRSGIWTWIYYLAHWLKTHKWNIKDFLDWNVEWENPLTIKEATLRAAWDVNNWNIDENMYRQNFDNWIEYDKEQQTILSYGESTGINEKEKCIVWLESVKFKTNVELVHAANIVNCLKYNLKWCWSAKAAFAETSTGWDISFSFSVDGANEVLSGSNSDFWQNTLAITWAVLWITAWVATKSGAVWIWATLWLSTAWYLWWQALDDNSSLGRCCSTIKDGDNFNKFIVYLNSIEEWWESIWLPWKQRIDSENKSPIQEYIKNVAEELDNTNITEIPEGKIRNLKAEQDPHNPNRYKISSYGQHTYITISWNVTMLSNWQVDPSSIESITIEKYSENDIWWELKLDFPHTKEGLKECLRVVNLSNMFRKKYGWYWWEKYPFFFNLMPYVQWNSMPTPIIPFIPPVNSAYDSGFWVDTNWEWNLSNKWERVIKNESLQKDCPTLLKDLAKNKENSQSYFEDQLNNKEDGSSFIKFLNWMRNISSQNYWTNWQNNS